MSQVYLIDGYAYDASYFGYTDPLTNIWRPKKYTGAFNNPGTATVWSDTYTASDGFQGAAPAVNGFDGNTSNRSACSSSGCTVTFTPATPITVNTSLRVYSGYGSASINGGGAVSYSGSCVGWLNICLTGNLT